MVLRARHFAGLCAIAVGVSISDLDRCAELDYVATFHHGIDLDALPFYGSPSQDVVAFGRVHPDNGTADAIAIARLAGRRLIICGIVQDERYFAVRGVGCRGLCADDHRSRAPRPAAPSCPPPGRGIVELRIANRGDALTVRDRVRCGRGRYGSCRPYR
jgi:hypothetical protein